MHHFQHQEWHDIEICASFWYLIHWCHGCRHELTGPSGRAWGFLQESESLQPTPLCLSGDTSHTTSIPRKGKALDVLIHSEFIHTITLKSQNVFQTELSSRLLEPAQVLLPEAPTGTEIQRVSSYASMASASKQCPPELGFTP